LQVGTVKRNRGNVSDWQSRLIEGLAGVILPANLLDDTSVFEDFFAHTEFEQDTQGVGPHRDCCSHVEELRGLFEDFWLKAKVSEGESRS
jgi:hypothetical protein